MSKNEWSPYWGDNMAAAVEQGTQNENPVEAAMAKDIHGIMSAYSSGLLNLYAARADRNEDEDLAIKISGDLSSAAIDAIIEFVSGETA